MGRQRIVFGTSHLYQETPVFVGQVPIAHYRYRGKTDLFWSTGKIEEALDRKMEIYVASVRFAFGEHDDWWQKLVPEDRVFSNNNLLKGGRVYSREVLSGILSYWKKMYQFLGIAWSEEFDDYQDPLAVLMKDHEFFYGKNLKGFFAQVS